MAGSSGSGSRDPVSQRPRPEGVVALKDCVRVLNGFGSSLEEMLPKLRDGYIAPDAATARRLAGEYAQGFLSASEWARCSTMRR